MGVAAFLAIEAVILALAAGIGGPPWAAIAAVACVAHLPGGMLPAVLAPALPALAWLGASVLTGNRELFFPYTMHLAAAAFLAVGGWPRGVLAGGAVIAAFMIVRVLQTAPPRVLAVELAAAVAVLAAVAAAQSRFLARRPAPAIAFSSRWWLPAAAAILACGCLAL